MRNLRVYLVSVLLLCLTAGCDQQHPYASPDEAVEAPPPIKESYGVRNVAWPPLDETVEQPLVASDLLRKNYYVVLDGSGSMDERKCSGDTDKMGAAKIALAEFAGSVPQDANLGLTVFYGGGIHNLVPLAVGNRDVFRNAVNDSYASGGTPLNNATVAAYRALELQGRSQLGYGEYHLVIVTDGAAGDPGALGNSINWILSNSPIIVHTIGFCIGDRHTLNQPGRTVYKAADNPEALRKGLEGVLAEAATFDTAEFSQ